MQWDICVRNLSRFELKNSNRLLAFASVMLPADGIISSRPKFAGKSLFKCCTDKFFTLTIYHSYHFTRLRQKHKNTITMKNSTKNGLKIIGLSLMQVYSCITIHGTLIHCTSSKFHTPALWIVCQPAHLFLATISQDCACPTVLILLRHPKWMLVWLGLLRMMQLANHGNERSEHSLEAS